ncbi:hypothetical protein B0J14DRAFT_566031 [Halenospora varia]|nr:hypothetical protein B0J14DRAFT_566031 [Halenospora varia]
MTLMVVNSMRGTDSFADAVSVLVSIGAGQKPTFRAKAKQRLPIISNRRIIQQVSKLIRRLVDTSTQTEEFHLKVKRSCKPVKFTQYYRWDGGEKVGGLELDEWRIRPKRNHPITKEFIETSIKELMKEKEAAAEIQRCAQELVNRRRARIAHKPGNGKWTRHTYCTVLRCPFCPADEYLPTKLSLKDHIITKHHNYRNLGIDDLDKFVQADGLLRHPHKPGGLL